MIQAEGRSVKLRKGADKLVRVLSSFAAFLGVFILGWILFVVLQKGFESMSLNFFTKLPTPPGMAGGGLANAIVGSFQLTALATLIGVPIGVGTGVFLAEYGRNSNLSNAVRFCANILMGTPSIIIGVFVFGLIVYHTKHFSGYAGAVALAILMLPIVARTTEDMIRLVPDALRESALALGASRSKVILSVVFRSAKSGLLTGILLAVARVSGETAPLLFTAMNSQFWPESFNEPIANLPVTIFNYAMSPYADWQQLAWGASFFIAVSVLGLTLISRILLRSKMHKA